MGVPASEVGYTSATPGRGDHEVHYGHVVALEEEDIKHFNNCDFLKIILSIRGDHCDYSLGAPQNLVKPLQELTCHPEDTTQHI
jgi:hypothetical protein